MRHRTDGGTPCRPRLSAERRRALELLGNSPRGVAEGLLVLAHGFDNDMIAGLVHTGLAEARRDTVEAGRRSIEVVRITITDAGRMVIES